MQTPKLITTDLPSQLFARRRYHEAGNRRNDTIEKWQKRERIGTLLLWIGAIVFTPIYIALWVYISHCECEPGEPAPWWFGISFVPSMLISLPSCCGLFVKFLLPRPCYGRWIIAFDGLFYRYGKSPHRFVPLSSLRNLRVEKPKSLFAVVVFDTDQEPLRIAERTDRKDKKPTEFLPFLNYLIDRLKQIGWSNADLTPLLKLQRVFQGRYIERKILWYTDYIIIACYLAPVFCVLPFLHGIATVPDPAILWVMAFCILVVCSIGYALNSRLMRWENGKTDKILHSLAQERATESEAYPQIEILTPNMVIYDENEV